MKRKSKGPVRRIRLRAVVAYPAVSLALVAAVALAMTPFGPSQGVALAASSIQMETIAPTSTSTPGATTTTTATPSSSATTSPTFSPSSGSVAAPGAAPGDHHVLARIEGSELQANYLPVDEPVPDAAQFQTFRVRFRLHNAGTAATTTTPRLDYRTEGASGFLVVPDEPKVGVPFHVAREWVPSLSLSGGMMQGPLGEDIPVADLRIGAESGLAVNGHRSMGANPDQPITLPSDSYTEEEFTVTLSIDAQYLTGYELRITNGGTPLTGTDVATIRLGAPPELQLSPGQRQGMAVVDPTTPSSSAGAAYPLLSAESIVASTASVSAVFRPNTQTYPLTANTLSTATYSSDAVHGPYSTSSVQCAFCHRGHAAQAPNLLVKGSQSTLCFTCHDGLGANANVQAQYTLARPVNNPAAREYYSHDALAPSTHTRSALDEFGGVSNRHSECADCHNSHKAKALADSTQTVTGWDASGRLAGVSGVSVVNGAAGTAPQYTFLSGENDPANADDPVTNVNPITLEYQLCFKCHSGFTTLTSNTGLKPSQYALDKGVEFNPANASFHPVEAAGTNQTTKMTDSLAGTSPYKMWNFTIGSTIRCLNCHASGTTPDTTPTPLPQPGSVLAPHTSSNRGILLKNYKDRVLKTTNAAYSAGDFALCYVCHAEAPFAPNGSATATNFKLHSLHLTQIAGKSLLNAGTDIDTAGDGQGNAICAECHFRIHSTTNKVGTQVVPGSRLVNFAPNVTPNGTTLSWTTTGTGSGSCTLTCHGVPHNGYNYSP
ncbi:MAG TPA: cytochrome c3 family protein [Dermatophilaceae bacterium]